MKKKVFSGIQPSGIVHLGNYLGALTNWVKLQEEFDCTYCIVDLHAITVPQDARVLRENIYDTALICLAIGINPEKSCLFIQSEVPEHAELTWILNCHAYFGELGRMTQFKEKAGKRQETTSVGIFDYPILMAADILLYHTDVVPVGDDQKQHLELSRTVAKRFNSTYGETFKVPEPLIGKRGARIMGLDSPLKKMSKSAGSDYNYIALNDNPDLIRRKIASAVTDSGREIKFDEKSKPAISNLLTIYSLMIDKSVRDIENEYRGKGYKEFKKDLAEVVIGRLRPIQDRLRQLEKDKSYVDDVLHSGVEKARVIAIKTLKLVKKRVGLGRK